MMRAFERDPSRLETGWPPEETVQATIETKGELWQDHEYLAKPSGRWPEIHSRPPKGLRERAIPDYNWEAPPRTMDPPIMTLLSVPAKPRVEIFASCDEAT